MMKKILSLFVLCSFLSCTQDKLQDNDHFVTSDIANFYEALDKIRSTRDTTEQMTYLKTLFIDKASVGQKAMFQARRYEPQEYLDAINAYPKFWTSIRPNMLKASEYSTAIQRGASKFNDLYPMEQMGKVYFTVGVFRSPGTTLGSMVLIGSEFALGDDKVITEEFPENLQYAVDYFAGNPIEDIVFLNVHEYVHTQQKTALNAHLLTQSMREGVAEFIAEKATGQESKSPALAYGRQNEAKLKEVFAQEMFNYDYTYWLWSSQEGPFDTRDLAYYMGYAMVDHFYKQSADKNEALRVLIELDYENDESLEKFVDELQFFNQSMQTLKADWEASRPFVTKVTPFKNGKIALGTHQCTAHFSEDMNVYSRGFDLGPLGENHVLGVKEVVGYGDELTTFSWTVEVQEKKQYQVVLTERFTSQRGMPLKRYLIDVEAE